jgi:hypothetical protein
MLPRAIESLLSWSFAIACLSVSGYHYVVGTLIGPYRRQIQSLLSNESREENVPISRRTSGSSSSCNSSDATCTTVTLTLPCWVPLMSYSRGELDRATPLERYQQFVQELKNIDGSKEKGVAISNNNIDSNSKESPNCNDNELVALIRTNETLRRLASLAMRPSDIQSSTSTSTSTSTSITTLQDTQCDVQQTPLGQQLIRIWPRLLELPALERKQAKDYPFSVSLIVPCYREQGSHVRIKLQHALNSSVHPEQIQLVLVDAGRCNDLGAAVSVSVVGDDDDDTVNNDGANNNNCNRSMNMWGQVKVIEYTAQGGRGPCLNFGVEHALGRTYAFLHSDTRLPAEWDTKLAGIFDAGSNNKCNDHNSSVATVSTSTMAVRANSCAFGFGIDTTREGLKGGSLPPGIRAVEVTANLRCQLWSLPYGDQCLCVPATIFDYIGGYPHQCFMEDYEFIALLRKRAALLPTLGAEEEALVIVPGAPALCSPRRWQAFGVLHVTYTNSKLVNLYAFGRTPEQIYELYYGQSPPSNAQLGPWETRLVVDGT